VFPSFFLDKDAARKKQMRHPAYFEPDVLRLIDLKRHWKTSMQAIVREAYDVGKMDERKYRYYNYEISRRGMKRNKAGEITEAIEIPALFKKLIHAHVTGLNYTPEEFSRLFGLPASELDRDYLPERPKLKLVI
jgi:Zn-dependent peptidase ImmA (M78 family)